jgi:hypothetical protein
MPPPITAKDLVAQVEKEILSAGSWRTPVLRAIRKRISRRMSWALRRLGTNNPAAARYFIDQHEAELAAESCVK